MRRSRTGPIERASFPSELRLFEVSSSGALGAEAMRAMLDERAPFDALLFRALTRATPSGARLRPFRAAMFGAAVTAPGASNVHAAILSNVLKLPLHTLVAASLLAIDRDLDSEIVAACAWASTAGSVPQALRSKSARETRLVRKLYENGGRSMPTRIGCVAACCDLFRAAGLQSEARISAAFRVAKLPVALAEALTSTLDMTTYPFKTPSFEYED